MGKKHYTAEQKIRHLWGKMEKVDTKSRIKYKDGGVQDGGDSTGKVHEGVSGGSGKVDNRGEYVIAGGGPHVVIAAIDPGELGEGI